MIDDRQEELASLHAFDLLEGSEKEKFVAEMAADPKLAQLVADLKRSATALAHSAPEATPPEALKARVMASARLKAVAVLPHDDSNVIRFPTWLAGLIAACLTVAALWAGRRYSMTHQEFASLREQQQVALQELDQTRAELAMTKGQLAEASLSVDSLTAKLKDEGDLAKYKISTLASMLGNTPTAVAVAVWDPSRERGVLSVSKLPALATDKDYQLWVIDAKYPAPVSAGTFVVDPRTGEAHIVFRADKPVESVAKFAVSLEPKGGSVSARGPIVLISQ
jgi:anti-sigma-K factor RskA